MIQFKLEKAIPLKTAFSSHENYLLNLSYFAFRATRVTEEAINSL